MRVAWLVLLAACSGAPPSTTTSATSAKVPKPATPPDPHAAIPVRERADQALHEDAPLDYERPLKVKLWDRSATAKLFANACELGDKHACIVAAHLAPSDASYRAVAKNCAAGDTYSCRALPLDEQDQRFPNAPGAMSRRVACQKPQLPAPCDLDALRHECLDGFPAACSEIGSAMPAPPDGDDLLARWPQLSLRGCRAGIASECQGATSFGTDSDRLDSAQRLCDLAPENCADLALVYKERNDTAGERDSFERACQYGGESRAGICGQLATAYVDGKLEEPVPGRAQALLDWACPRIAAKFHDATLRVAPGCAQAHADMK